MTASRDLHQTASDYFLVMIANGRTPTEAEGGLFDGLRYFVTEIDGCEYWVTEKGLFDPPWQDVHGSSPEP
jgi:hypothetical protein